MGCTVQRDTKPQESFGSTYRNQDERLLAQHTVPSEPTAPCVALFPEKRVPLGRRERNVQVIQDPRGDSSKPCPFLSARGSGCVAHVPPTISYQKENANCPTPPTPSTHPKSVE